LERNKWDDSMVKMRLEKERAVNAAIDNYRKEREVEVNG
jgi:hypothetical protein